MIRSILFGFIAALAALLLAERFTWRPAAQIVVMPVSAKAPKPATRPTLPSIDARRILISVDFELTPVDQALKQIQRLSGVQVIVLWQKPGRPDIDRSRPITLQAEQISLKRVLRMVLNQAAQEDPDGLTFEIEENTAVVRRISDAAPPAIIRMYNVRDIIAEAVKRGVRSEQWFGGAFGFRGTPIQSDHKYDDADAIQDLANLIKETIDRESWIDNGGKYGSVRYFAGLLIVEQTVDNLELIEDLLEKIRKGGE